MALNLEQTMLRARVDFAEEFIEARNGQPTSCIAVQVLDQLAAGVIVTDGYARVIAMNRAGEVIVGLEDGLLVRNDQLCARRVFETAKVRKLIACASTEEQPSSAAGRMLVARSYGVSPYALTVAPLRINPIAHEQRLAMVVVVDPQRHSPSEKDLAEFYGMTPAEARLALALLTGKTLADIAAVTDVRITTLRTQLGSILRKTGARRQADLVRLLSSTGIASLSLAAGWLDVALEALQVPLLLAGV